MPITVVLKKADKILDNHASLDYDKTEYPIGYPFAVLAIKEYAEQNSLAFVRWRGELTLDMSRRRYLDLPLTEQYQIFIKENGL